ncbi:MAG: hypothetical protein HYW45_02280 [Candidatus Daviesbacteria bacterium]|nr:MAG: hypothetical protein HYW45_02280 [Candidatus Daviesbacteria bacterium]
MVKKLITHINPHLDDIAAIWLFKKFSPDLKEVKIEFVSATVGNQSQTESSEQIFIGVGRGKFDEHKGDLEDCATSLVWKEIKQHVSDKIAKLALEDIVEWVRLGDLGRLPTQQYGDFSVPAFIRPTDNSEDSSRKAVELGEEILDRILEVQKRKQRSLADWQNRVEFTSKFGKTCAVESAFVNRGFCDSQEGELFLMYDPKSLSTQYYTPVMEIDLEPIYKKLKEVDPNASWYLHQSHHMVICGSGSAPDAKQTKLTFEQLIEVVKNT